MASSVCFVSTGACGNVHECMPTFTQWPNVFARCAVGATCCETNINNNKHCMSAQLWLGESI